MIIIYIWCRNKANARAQERVRATNIVVFVEKNNVEIIRDIIF